MINLPFDQDIPYKKHQKSYLQQAVVFLRFAEVEIHEKNALAINTAWNKYTLSNFSLNVGDFRGENVISKEDNSVDYVFTKNFVVVRIPGKNYISFGDTLIPHIYKMKKFLKDVLNVETLSQYEIRKWDAWQIQKVNEYVNFESSITNFFLSEDFLNYRENIDDSVRTIENEKLVNALCWESAEEKYSVNSTILQNGANDNFVDLILYSNGIKKQDISLDRLEDELESLNMTLHKIFNWAISKNSKDLMDR